MTIRDATAADAAAIAAIWNPVIRDSEITFNSVEKSAAEVAALIAAGHAFLVAETDRTVRGFASYSQFRGGSGYVHTMEHTVILSAAARGLGLGRAVMQALEDHARARSVHAMIAGISSANPDAMRFHARLGYVEVGVLPETGRKFGRLYDLHLMQKRL